LTEALATPAANIAMRRAARANILENYDLRSLSLPRLLAFLESGGR
jgi:hypothetical protein